MAHPVVLGTASPYSISVVVPPDEARFDSHLTPVLCSNSSAPELALVSIESRPPPSFLYTKSELNLS